MMKKLFTLLLSVMMMLTPVLAGAESANDGVQFVSIANPVFSVYEGEDLLSIDLTGLEFKVAVESTEDALNLFAGLLANGKDAVGAHLGADAEGLYATLCGMTKGVELSFASIEEIVLLVLDQLEAILAELDLGELDALVEEGEFDLEAVFGFSDEAIETFGVAVESFIASIELSEPDEGVTELEDGSSIAIASINYLIPGEAFGSLMHAFGDLLADNVIIASIFDAALAEAGVTEEEQITLGDALELIMLELGFYMDGIVVLVESDNYLMFDNNLYFLNGFDEEGLPVYDEVYLGVNCSYDDEGTYASVRFDPTEDEYVTVDVYVLNSEKVEGMKEFYYTINAFDNTEEEPVLIMSYDVKALPYVDEDDFMHFLIDYVLYAEGETLSYGADFFEYDGFHGVDCYVDVLGEFYVDFGYEGVPEGSIENGSIWGIITDAQENVLASANIDVAFGTDTEGSLDFDKSAIEFIDVLTFDEETIEALTEDMTNGIANGILTLAEEIPFIGSLLESMISAD